MISNNNIECAMFTSPVRHNLRVNDTIILRFGDGEDEQHSVKCKVVSIGSGNMENREYVFCVRMSDFYDYVVVNDDLDKAINEVREIIVSNRD